MVFIVKVIDGVKKIIPVTADVGAGNPVGTIIVVCSNQIPSNYLPLGTQFDITLYPVLYALLGTNTTPTASALGLPTLTSGQYAIKATSGLSENAQDNVINTLNEQRSYSTEEHLTGRKWIDGKPTYEKVFVLNTAVSLNAGSWATINDIDVSTFGAIVDATMLDSINFAFKGFYLNKTNDNKLRILTPQSYEVKTIILEYTKATD